MAKSSTSYAKAKFFAYAENVLGLEVDYEPAVMDGNHIVSPYSLVLYHPTMLFPETGCHSDASLNPQTIVKKPNWGDALACLKLLGKGNFAFVPCVNPDCDDCHPEES